MGKLGSKSPRRPESFSRSDRSRRASNRAGRSMKRTLQRRNGSHDRSRCRVDGGADPLPTRGRPMGSGEGCWRVAPGSSSRRRGDGTHGRITDPKQGRSWRQPRSGRRAKTCCISSDPVKSAGVSKAGGSGRSSEDGRDNRTLPERRTRGLRWPLERPEAWSADNADRLWQEGTRATKAVSNQHGCGCMRTWRLKPRPRWAGHG